MKTHPDNVCFTHDELLLIAQLFSSDQAGFSSRVHVALHGVMTKLPGMIERAAPADGFPVTGT